MTDLTEYSTQKETARQINIPNIHPPNLKAWDMHKKMFSQKIYSKIGNMNDLKLFYNNNMHAYLHRDKRERDWVLYEYNMYP